jgi:hypothetical protein
MIELKQVLSEQQLMLLETDRALDIEVIGRPMGDTEVWQLLGYLDDVEYLWGSTGKYAGSIGRTEDGRYFVAPDYRFKDAEGFLCVWYR